MLMYTQGDIFNSHHKDSHVKFSTCQQTKRKRQKPEIVNGDRT